MPGRALSDTPEDRSRGAARVLWVASAALLVFGAVELALLDVHLSVGAVRVLWAALTAAVALVLPRARSRTRARLLTALGCCTPVLFAALLVLREDLSGVSFAFFLATPMVFAVLLRAEVGATIAASASTLLVGVALFRQLPGAHGDVIAWAIGSVASGGVAVYSSVLFRRAAGLAARLHAEQVRAVETRAREAQARSQSERAALLSQVAAGLAHEINNPLAAITANLGFLERATGPQATEDDRAEVAEVVRSIGESSARVAGVMRRMQALAPPPSRERGSCDPVAELRALLAELPRPGGCVVDDRMPANAPEVAVPPTQLRRVVQQIVQGAVDALAGQERSTLTLECQVAERSVELVLRDDGAIERAEDADASRGELRARGKDSGLGLTLVAEACRAFGGALEVTRAPGGGERVAIRLPRSLGA